MWRWILERGEAVSTPLASVIGGIRVGGRGIGGGSKRDALECEVKLRWKS